MIIRKAGPDDLAAIAAIQASSPEASQWKAEDYLRYACLVCTACPLPDGRGSVHVPPLSALNRDRERADTQAFIVTRDLAPDEHEILNLAVAPSARRTGLARGLLAHVLQPGSGSWFLEVRASNHPAIRLYESTGFRSSGTRQGYYRESPEPAIVMHFQK